MTGDEIETAVCAEIRRILDGQGKRIERMVLDDSLSETLGLTSLDLVEVIDALNARFDVDPFRQRAFTELRTVGDLCRAYGTAHAQVEADSDPALAISRPRAEARRDRWRSP